MNNLMILLPEVPSIILNIPIILSLVAVIRYVIGFKTWKNYPVMALTLAYFLFFQLLDSTAVALVLWVLFTVIIIGTAILTRYLIRRLKVNYYARIAIMYLGAVVLALLTMFVISKTAYGALVSNLNFGLGVFLIASTIDELATLLFKKDAQEFTRRTISTTGVALIAGLLITWSWWNKVLGGHQEILIIVLVIDIIISFWTAIRATELIRFNSILKNQR